MRPESPLLVAAGVKDPDKWINAIIETCAEFEINTPQRVAAFLAQTSHESGGYTMLSENLNYKAATLTRLWPQRYPPGIAEQYAGKPQAIAKKSYGGRMGNGDESTGEGYKFRGRGYIQLTGKSNYTGFAKFIGEDTVANPDLVATKYPLMSAYAKEHN